MNMYGPMDEVDDHDSYEETITVCPVCNASVSFVFDYHVCHSARLEQLGKLRLIVTGPPAGRPTPTPTSKPDPNPNPNFRSPWSSMAQKSYLTIPRCASNVIQVASHYKHDMLKSSH